MKQSEFEQCYAAAWDALEQQVAWLERPARGAARPDLSQFPDAYRQLIRQHALAVDRHYGALLIERLQTLMQRCHRQFYRRPEFLLSQWLEFLAHGFPQAVRQHARLFWVASALFYLPAMAMGVWTYQDASAIYRVLDATEVRTAEYSYDPSNRHPGRGAERQSSTNFQMFGFYVANNTGIGFRSFAGGLLFGIGSVVVTLFNGTVIGAFAGHLTGLGHTEIFWPFVVGHAAFELTAICISAAAGLLLGKSLLFPGPQRRVTALQAAARQAVPLVIGAALLFFIAAFVEAFWSPRDIAPAIRYAVGGAFWVLLIAYLSLAGRGRHAT